jgi:microcystin-dependent protein
MDDIKNISELKSAMDLLGNEQFIVNQKNPKYNNEIETRLASLKQVMNYFANSINSIINTFIPTGTVQAYAGDIDKIDIINGWLLCNGQQVSKELHSSLYNIIKDYYTPAGVTPATDKFYLPDLKGKAVMGFCNFKTPYKLAGAKVFNDGVKLGKLDGYFSHKLNEDEIPSHNHGVFEHTHLYFDYFKVNDAGRSMGDDRDSECDFVNNRDYPGIGEFLKHLKGKKAKDEFYSDTLKSQGSVDDSIGDEPHNNVQPSLVLNYIIKT